MAETRVISSTGGAKGAKLARYDLIPAFVLQKLAEHYGRGALKYADHNWRRGYKWSLSYAALVRHLQAFWDGEDLDVCAGHEQDCAFVTSEGEPFEGVPGVECYNHTGNHHLDGVNFHGFALRYFAEYFPDYDDRFKYPTVTKSDTPPSFVLNPTTYSPSAIYKQTNDALRMLRLADGEPKCGNDVCLNPNCHPETLEDKQTKER